jgi:hypothetical protein
MDNGDGALSLRNEPHFKHFWANFMFTALLLLGAAGVAEGGSSGNLTPATLVRYQGTNVSEKSYGRGI